MLYPIELGVLGLHPSIATGALLFKATRRAADSPELAVRPTPCAGRIRPVALELATPLARRRGVAATTRSSPVCPAGRPRCSDTPSACERADRCGRKIASYDISRFRRSAADRGNRLAAEAAVEPVPDERRDRFRGPAALSQHAKFTRRAPRAHLTLLY
jgi:hypothetical protein